MVVISSGENGVAKYHGGFLGQYEYDEENEYYVQSSTEESNKQYTASYLYKDEDDDISDYTQLAKVMSLNIKKISIYEKLKFFHCFIKNESALCVSSNYNLIPYNNKKDLGVKEYFLKPK